MLTRIKDLDSLVRTGHLERERREKPPVSFVTPHCLLQTEPLTPVPLLETRGTGKQAQLFSKEEDTVKGVHHPPPKKRSQIWCFSITTVPFTESSVNVSCFIVVINYMPSWNWDKLLSVSLIYQTIHTIQNCEAYWITFILSDLILDCSFPLAQCSVHQFITDKSPFSSFKNQAHISHSLQVLHRSSTPPSYPYASQCPFILTSNNHFYANLSLKLLWELVRAKLDYQFSTLVAYLTKKKKKAQITQSKKVRRMISSPSGQLRVHERAQQKGGKSEQLGCERMS